MSCRRGLHWKKYYLKVIYRSKMDWQVKNKQTKNKNNVSKKKNSWQFYIYSTETIFFYYYNNKKKYIINITFRIIFIHLWFKLLLYPNWYYILFCFNGYFKLTSFHRQISDHIGSNLFKTPRFWNDLNK